MIILPGGKGAHVSDWADWPQVPEEDRPKSLYVNTLIRGPQRREIEQKGWKLVDVRLMPNETDADRAESIKAWLEGVRIGSIQADSAVIKLIELTARAYGLIGNKVVSGVQAEASMDLNVDDLLNFQSRRGSPIRALPTSAKKAGHPFTSKRCPDNVLGNPAKLFAFLEST